MLEVLLPLEMPKATTDLMDCVSLLACPCTFIVRDRAPHCFVDIVCREFRVVWAQQMFNCLTAATGKAKTACFT